ncbi:MAG: hypothetical protein HZC44_07125 [Geobacter sp.]|nr:hypothetical protein [Geobacter sp.]
MITTAIQQHKIERDRTLAATTIPRELLNKTLPQMESSLIKVITGPRRAGKSGMSGILAAARELSCSQLTVLTGNETWEKSDYGLTVRALPVWKWLLMREV